MRIAVVGAGIGGLTLAAALRAQGMDCDLYEATPVLADAGMGVQLSPNAVRPLRRLGIRLPAAVPLDAVEVRGWSGRPLARTDLGAACEAMFGAPYWGVRRSDLQRALLHLIDPAGLHLGVRVVRAAADGTLDLASGGRVRADVVVGADGLRSVVRAAVSADRPRFSGLGAYRGLVPADRLGPGAARAAARIWLGPDRHLVSYPVAGGDLISFAAIAPMAEPAPPASPASAQPASPAPAQPASPAPAQPASTTAAPAASMAAEFGRWHGLAGRLAQTASDVSRWPLYDRDPLPAWGTGRLTLLGDAAHPMLPFLAQGANQAIEDAVQLAAVLREAQPTEVPDHLAGYAALRGERTATIVRLARAQGTTGHLPDGPEQQARDAELRRHAVLGERAWLYGHDVRAEVAA